jgi:hypothetical protein
MRKTLLLSAALLGLSAMSANAATVLNLGVNPDSITGAFSSISFGGTGKTGSGAFDDQITFQLVGGPAFLTIASVTNVYAKASDFITGFTGKVLFLGADGVLGGIGANADTTVIGPTAATACPLTPNCQGFAGSAILTLVGNYALDLSGVGGGTSGYGGNLAVAEVPIPGALALFATGLVGLGMLRRRKKSLNVA